LPRGKTSHKKRKFRILLDSAFAKPSSFPLLCKYTNLAHPIYDYGLSQQEEDKAIFQKAIEDNRIVLTVNFKHFKKFVRKDKPGVIGIESQLFNEQIDKLVSGFLKNKNPDDFIGNAIKIISKS